MSSIGGSRQLFDRLRHDVLEDSVALTQLLRICLMLGGDVGSIKLRDWAVRELKGYRDEDHADNLPDYRRIPAGLYMEHADGSTQPVTRAQLALPEHVIEKIPDQVPIPHGTAELEALIKEQGRLGRDTVHFSMQGMPGIAALAGNQQGGWFQNVEWEQPTSGLVSAQLRNLFWELPVSGLVGVAEAVKNRLVELVAEIDAATPGGTAPTPEVADQAVNISIYGDSNRLNVASNGSLIDTREGAGEGTWWSSWSRGRKIVAVGAVLLALVGGAAAVFQIFDLWDEINWPPWT